MSEQDRPRHHNYADTGGASRYGGLWSAIQAGDCYYPFPESYQVFEEDGAQGKQMVIEFNEPVWAELSDETYQELTDFFVSRYERSF